MSERQERVQAVDVAVGVFAGAGVMWAVIATGWLTPTSYMLGAATIVAWRIWQLARFDRRARTDEPEPPRWTKPAAATLVFVVYSLSMVGVGKLTVYRAMIDADEIAHEAEVAQGMLKKCLSVSDQLAFDAVYAAHYTQSAHEAIASFLGRVPGASVEWVVEGVE